MKIIVTLSALVLIVSLWGCSSTPAGSEAQMSGECAGIVGLVTSRQATSATKRNVSSTTCGQAAMNISPASK